MVFFFFGLPGLREVLYRSRDARGISLIWSILWTFILFLVMANETACRVVPRIFAAWGMVSRLDRVFLAATASPYLRKGFLARKKAVICFNYPLTPPKCSKFQSRLGPNPSQISVDRSDYGVGECPNWLGSPAMVAGVTNRLWSLEELINA